MRNRKNVWFCVLLTLALVFSAFPVSANYVTGKIKVYDDGRARFDIETDVPIKIEGLSFHDNKTTGITETLTKKESGLWTFSLNLTTYDSILLDVELPGTLNAIVNIDGPANMIDLDKKTISVIDSGKLDFSVSYKLKTKTSYLWLIWPGLIVLLTFGFFLYLRIRKKHDRLEHVLPMINDIEKEIIDSLMNGPVRQKELRKILNIPKASFSRYMVNLEKKKLIIREGEGKNKMVKLK